MAVFTNYYETVQEANMRLRGTIILYAGEPHYVLCISDHKNDGIFRIYIEPIGKGEKFLSFHKESPPPVNEYPTDHPSVGAVMDAWLEDRGKNSGVIRKSMDSTLFNKFRPFPLGMTNWNGMVLHLERHPNRRTEQGLAIPMVVSNRINLEVSRAQNLPRFGGSMAQRFDYYGEDFYNCVKGIYPSVQDCLTQMKSKTCTNDAVAFSRDFAFVKGPLSLLFLAYKTDVVGYLPTKELSNLVLAKEFSHVKEAVIELGVFSNLTIQQ